MIIKHEDLIISDQSTINTPPPAPKKADGTVDWDVVFEDPNYGLIPALEKASSVEGIRHVISVAAQHLYKRRNDASLRSTFINHSEIILAKVADEGASFDEVQQTFVASFQKEKAERIKKAEAYVRQKERGQSLERRGNSLSASIAGALFSPGKLGLKLAVIVALVIGGLVAAWFLVQSFSATMPFVPSTEADKASPVVKEKTTEPNAPKSSEKEQQDTPPPPTPEVQSFIAMKPVLVSLIDEKGKRQGILLVPIAMLKDPDDKAKICRLTPKISDIVNSAAFKKREEPGSPLAPKISAISREARDEVISLLGEGYITNFNLFMALNMEKKILSAAYRGCGLVTAIMPEN